eukprot:g5708.t1
MEIEKTNFSQLKVVQLKSICRQRKLKVSGRKAELISRIMDSIEEDDIEIQKSKSIVDIVDERVQAAEARGDVIDLCSSSSISTSSSKKRKRNSEEKTTAFKKEKKKRKRKAVEVELIDVRKKKKRKRKAVEVEIIDVRKKKKKRKKEKETRQGKSKTTQVVSKPKKREKSKKVAKSYPRRIIRVAGTSFRRESLAQAIQKNGCVSEGEINEHSVRLEKEPKNQFDRYAIKIIVSGCFIGYVPMAENRDVKVNAKWSVWLLRGNTCRIGRM